MTTLKPSEERDYFTDHSVLRDPYDYFDSLRSKSPVYQSQIRDVVYITGFNEEPSRF